MESEGCKIPRFNSVLNFLFPVNILVFCFFKTHFNALLLSKPKSISMKYSQADNRVKILTRLSAWDNFMELCRYESFKTRSLYWSYSVSYSMWNSVHIVFLHEVYVSITSEEATQRWTNLHNENVCTENLSGDKEPSGLNIESTGPLKCCYLSDYTTS
jgi:hypothetical protein